MITRSKRTWLIFLCCLLLVALALFWVTREVLSLEEREASARREAQVHESMRLALWRMDSAFAPILAQEAARAPVEGCWPPPPPHFEPFRLYFSIDASGRPSTTEIAAFVAPLRPPESRRDKSAEGDRAPASRPFDDLRASLEALVPPPPQQAGSPQLEQSKDEYQSRVKMAQNAQQTLMAENKRVPEEERGQAVDGAMDLRNGFPAVTSGLPAAGCWIVADAESGALQARWLTGPGGEPELFLVRTLREKPTGLESQQGIWCDWQKLERWLLENTHDLFDEGRLVPSPHPSEADEAALLATIPARFSPGSIKRAWERSSTPTRLILVVAWVAALGAVVAVGGVLRAAMSLGERRGRFVSAVTHELRTPLTTFRMYSQMLADGMVPAATHPEYLATLKQESERLSRVVESVLLYSRLEEGRGGAHRETISCRALLDRILPAARKRAADGGMSLEISLDVGEDATVEVDAQAVEQILLNLVDNACKYAQPVDPRILLSCRTTGRALEVFCRDFGPGIPAEERDAVFLPFRRGARDSAGTTPGVGLGLSLARGLARASGGDLVLDGSRGAGSCFVLTLPL